MGDFASEGLQYDTYRHGIYVYMLEHPPTRMILWITLTFQHILSPERVLQTSPLKVGGSSESFFTSDVSMCELYNTSNRSFLYNFCESIIFYYLLLCEPLPVAVRSKAAARLLRARV